MTPCTLWFRQPTPVHEMAYNHLGIGHQDKPAPCSPEQARLWRGARWERSLAWLTDDVPPKVVHYSPDEAAA